MSARRRPGFAASLALGGFTPRLQRELQLPGLLAPGPSETHGWCALPSVRPFAAAPSLLRPLLTARSASRRCPFGHEASAPQVRTRSFPAPSPHLRRLGLDHKSFAIACSLALPGTASYAVRVPRRAVFAPRFLPTLGHPHAVALHFARCGQLTGGLAPPRSRPCWAHKPNRPSAEWRTACQACQTMIPIRG